MLDTIGDDEFLKVGATVPTPETNVARDFTFDHHRLMECRKIIESNYECISNFRKSKYAAEATKNWDLFYKRNNINFFKDRKWIDKEFQIDDNANCNGRLHSTVLNAIDIDGPGNLDSSAESIKEKNSSENYTNIPFKAAEFEDEDAVGINVEKTVKYIENCPAKCGRIAVDIGCGVGNTIVPFLRNHSNFSAVCVDCSSRAIDLLKSRWISQTAIHACSAHCSLDSEQAILNDFAESNCDSMVIRAEYRECGKIAAACTLDISKEDIPVHLVAPNTADIVFLIFVLSALLPKTFEHTAMQCATVLKSGGRILIRDYARYDTAQLRFARGTKSKIDTNFYVRYDGTMAYYFKKHELTDLFVAKCGLKEVENSYILRCLTNRKNKTEMYRVWIQAVYEKP